MPGHDIVVIGASAGGVEVLRTIASGLPADLPAAVLVTMHMSPDGPALLHRVLSRAGPLPAETATDGAVVEKGRIFVARPDHHLMVEKGRLRVVRGPKENRARPAIDPLFRSAALEYGPRVIGVVLTGSLDDGAAGLATIKERGGLAVVQDPEDALYPSMPRSALAAVRADVVAPASEIAGALTRLVSQGAARAVEAAVSQRAEVAMGAGEPEDIRKLGEPSPYGCPECGGVLSEVEDPHLMRFRCRVGHAYTAESLVAEQDETIEDSLWAALRALEESAGLKKRLADRFRPREVGALVRRLDAGAREAEKHAESLRRLLGSLEKQLED